MFLSVCVFFFFFFGGGPSKPLKVKVLAGGLRTRNPGAMKVEKQLPLRDATERCPDSRCWLVQALCLQAVRKAQRVRAVRKAQPVMDSAHFSPWLDHFFGGQVSPTPSRPLCLHLHLLEQPGLHWIQRISRPSKKRH